MGRGGGGGGGPPGLWLLFGLLALLRAAAAADAAAAPSFPSYKALEDRSSSRRAHKCHNPCPTGFMPKTRCSLDPRSDCVKKQCRPDQFLNSEYPVPRCENCLSCSPGRKLVVKAQCTHNSSGVCECEQGLYCATKVPNTCARCLPLTTCKPGFGVKIRGTSDRDTVCEACPPGTFSEEDSSTETCRPRAVNISSVKGAGERESSTMQDIVVGGRPLDHPSQQLVAMRPTAASSILISVAPSDTRDAITGQATNEQNHRGSPDIVRSDRTSKKEGKDFTLVAVALVLTFLLLSALGVLWKKRVCKKRIIPHKMKMSRQAKISATGTLSPAEKDPEEAEVRPLESLSETEETPCLDPGGAEPVQKDGRGVVVEPAVMSHTSNCIDKIYIMRADTVIVGSVSEVPTSNACPGKGGDVICGGPQETEVAVRYPEQETEGGPPASDIMTPVEEEEGETIPHSTLLAHEKAPPTQEESPGGTS